MGSVLGLEGMLNSKVCCLSGFRTVTTHSVVALV
jgi:hypothetical protein